jgi:hypothetical protein
VAGAEQRGVPVAVNRVGVGAGVQEQPGDVRRPALGGEVQRGQALGVRRVRRLGAGGRRGERGERGGRPLGVVQVGGGGEVERRAAGEQQVDHRLMAAPAAVVAEHRADLEQGHRPVPDVEQGGVGVEQGAGGGGVAALDGGDQLDGGGEPVLA